jgi:ferredoxin
LSRARSGQGQQGHACKKPSVHALESTTPLKIYSDNIRICLPLAAYNEEVLKGILDAVFNLTDPRPNYVGDRCLVEKHSVGGCDKCMQACPHEAVTIGNHVEINDNCTGCGLCVQACPTGALEYDLLKPLTALKNQGTTSARAEGETRVSSVLKCSKVPGDEPTLECLGRVTPAMLLASTAWGQDLTLVRGACHTCKLGGPTVPDSVESVIQIATEYRKHLEPNDVRVAVLEYQPEMAGPSTPSAPPKPVSRRDALGALARNTRESAAKLIPENPLPGLNTKPETQIVPDEWQWRRKALRPAPEAEIAQYWPVPSVNEDCIFCPVCTNVCPTEAVRRERDEGGLWKIELEVSACTGCNACVLSCPPTAMKLEPEVAYETLDQTVLLREGDGY